MFCTSRSIFTCFALALPGLIRNINQPAHVLKPRQLGSAKFPDHDSMTTTPRTGRFPSPQGVFATSRAYSFNARHYMLECFFSLPRSFRPSGSGTVSIARTMLHNLDPGTRLYFSVHNSLSYSRRQHTPLKRSEYNARRANTSDA